MSVAAPLAGLAARTEKLVPAALFPASAVMWWLFEYLNQFVRNWYYAGVVASGDWDYFLQATLPFSTDDARAISSSPCG